MGDMFLQLIDPDIHGESLDEAVPKAHRREIEITGWTWGLTNPDSKASEGKDEPAKTNVGSIVVHKIYDAASLPLIASCARKTNISIGKITCRKNDGNQKLDYLVIKLEDVKIRTINWPTPTDEIVSEDVELVFTKFYVTYKPQLNKGDGLKMATATGSIDFGWDITENKEDDSLAWV